VESSLVPRLKGRTSIAVAPLTAGREVSKPFAGLTGGLGPAEDNFGITIDIGANMPKMPTYQHLTTMIRRVYS
jgi:hypothetical protein